MLLVIGTALAFALLDWPWRLAVIGALGAIESLEIMLWLRLRRTRALTGADALVGARGKAITDCAPVGQVKVRGAIWKARSSGQVSAGDEVEVTSVSGLELVVRRVTPTIPAALTEP